MIEYLYPSLASLLIGLRVISYKLMSLNSKYYNYLLVFVLITIVSSQYLIYKSMFYINNPTIINLILYSSVFITFFFTVFILKQSDFNSYYFFIGLVFIIIGILFIQTSYDT